MSLWDDIQKALKDVRERTLGALLSAMAARREQRNHESFSIALIALSAKMAKADGIVTDDEVEAFGNFFSFPPSEEKNVRLIFRLAQKDVAGFGHYLTQVAKIFNHEPTVLEDVLDCLFYIAVADGVAHPGELAMLREAAEKFGLADQVFRRLQAVHFGLDDHDPYVILGAPVDASDADLKSIYHELARSHHPDALAARGVPADLVRIAEKRLATINAAYEKITAERAMPKA